MLSQSREVALYRAEAMLLAGCERKYGSLRRNANKQRFGADWLRSRQFNRLGINRVEGEKFLARSNSYAKLMRLTLDDLAERQGKAYWLDSTPANVHALPTILRDFPGAKIINVVRDGRAVAASLRKLGWTGVKARSELAGIQFSALKWYAALESYSTNADTAREQMTMVRYEDLVQNSNAELERLQQFIGLEPFNYSQDREDESTAAESDRAHISGNTAFGDLGTGLSTAPLTRWKKSLSESEIRAVEIIGAEYLSEFGYELMHATDSSLAQRLTASFRRTVYQTKQRIKDTLPLRSLYSTPLESADY